MEYIFGDKTWYDLRKDINRLVTWKARGTPLADLEDAVQEGVLYVIDYYLQTDEAKQQSKKELYASCRHLAYRRALRYLAGLEKAKEEPYDYGLYPDLPPGEPIWRSEPSTSQVVQLEKGTETEVWRMWWEGYTIDQTAKALDMSASTVQRTRKNIAMKVME